MKTILEHPIALRVTLLQLLFVSARETTTGQELIHTFSAPTPRNGAYFGEGVAIEGNEVLISADGDNQVHLFNAAIRSTEPPMPTDAARPSTPSNLSYSNVVTWLTFGCWRNVRT